MLAVVALLALTGLREVLVARTTTRADEDLHEHVDHFVDFIGNATGTQDTDLGAAFHAYVKGAGPNEDETFVLFAEGRQYTAPGFGGRQDEHMKLLRPLAGTTRRQGGELATRGGRFRYAIAPIHTADDRSAAFAVSLDFGQEISDEVTAPLLLAGSGLIVLLLAGSALVAFVAGRALAPVRAVSETARAINESDLSRRIGVRGHDAGSELARTFNAMLDRLQSAFASQHDFVRDAEHELRTPLTIIRGHLETLSDDPLERRQAVDLVLDEVDRMTRLVGDLLVLARAEQPDFLQLEELDLEVLATELHAKATGLAPREWRLVQAAPGWVRADRQRLTQAVLNLAENAVRHTEEDSIIEFGATLESAGARIWVRDGGPGIEPGDEQRIFERFARGKGISAGDGEGTGLGLAIVRVIAEAHGGSVGVRNCPGLGATFEIILPAAQRVKEAIR